MKFQRLALVAVLIVAGTVLAAPWSHGATTPAPAGLPIYQFVNSGAGTLPWNAVSLTSQLGTNTMLGAPHAISNAAEGVVAFRTQANDLAYFTQSATGSTSFVDISKTEKYIPAPASDPQPFFDPAGNVDLLYLDTSNDVVVVSPNNALAPFENHFGLAEWHPYAVTNIGEVNRVPAISGLPSIQVSGESAIVAYRSTNDHVLVNTLSWQAPSVVPVVSAAATDVIAATGNVASTPAPTTTTTLRSSAPTTTTTKPKSPTTTTTVKSTGSTTTTTFVFNLSGTTTTTTRPATPTTTTTVHVTSPTTTTTKPKSPTTTTTKPAGTTTTTTSTPTTTTTLATTSTTSTTTTTVPATSSTFTPLVSDPVVLPGGADAVAAINSLGDLIIYSSTSSTWSRLDVTALTGAPKVAGTLSVSSNATTLFLAALTSSGTAEIFSTPLVGYTSSLTSHVVMAPPTSWSAENTSSVDPSAPPLDGSIFLNASSTQLTVAGQAANWGDLFSLTGPIGAGSWTATDVSVTGGSAARTVGQNVTGTFIGTALTLYAAGVDSPPREGVGLYAIPSSDWSKAITSGWPILSETGGLGTQSSPWIGFTSTNSVAQSPDFLLGQAIYNSHQRVTWLSFWTVSGPLSNEAKSTTTYYNHGFAGGAWVATQIDQYRGLGVGLKPDWVIFDPEGYPDNHSGLDAPDGASQSSLATYATYWQAMLKGWAAGLASVDPSLNAGVYASQSEYRNYGLVNQSLPVFMAVAFGGGGPVQVAGTSGSNIRGYIAFDASCSSSSLSSEISTLENPPWSGQFNTLQFNAGVYCAPPKS